MRYLAGSFRSSAGRVQETVRTRTGQEAQECDNPFERLGCPNWQRENAQKRALVGEIHDEPEQEKDNGSHARVFGFERVEKLGKQLSDEVHVQMFYGQRTIRME